MTDKTPLDWVLTEAAKRSGKDWAGVAAGKWMYDNDQTFRALCDMIAKYEQPPVNRKLQDCGV